MVEKKNLENMRDDTWKKKAHYHEPKELIPTVCQYCKGTGYLDSYECPWCEGTGEVYE